MLFATTLCWLSLGIIIAETDPFTSGRLVFAFFYASLFLSFVGTISLVHLVIMVFIFRRHEPLFRIVGKTFKGGLIGASVLTGVIFLQGLALLTAWHAGFFLLAAVSLAIFFATRPDSATHSTS